MANHVDKMLAHIVFLDDGQNLTTSPFDDELKVEVVTKQNWVASSNGVALNEEKQFLSAREFAQIKNHSRDFLNPTPPGLPVLCCSAVFAS